MQGRVIRVKAKTYTVLADNKEYQCEVFSKAKRDTGQTLVAVGDVVDFVSASDGPGGIERVHPRTTKFSRPKVGLETSEQIIVSNIDQMVIIASVAQPPLKLYLIDRFTVAAYKGGLSPIVVLNKIDLKHRHDLERIKVIYHSIGVAVVLSSTLEMKGVDDLRHLLTNHESIFVGHSGTGKSSLLNLLQPGLKIRTGEVSAATDKGIHTTTSIELYPLDFGGYVVDSPGLKILGLWDLSPDELQEYFPEFHQFIGGCKFRRCSHLHEPECAVRQAVSEGRIFPERFESYGKIYQSL